MTDRFPGYDVLAKRDTLSWNDATRRVIDARLNIKRGPGFFTADEWPTLTAICARIMPQPPDREPVPLPDHVQDRLINGWPDGYRYASMPDAREAWKRGLAALDAEAHARHGKRFHEVGPAEQDALLRLVQQGATENPAWGGMPPKMFFMHRLLPDVTHAYYAHPFAWSELGYGGPASPRGYVRMRANRRDPWEAAEATPGNQAKAERENRHVRDI